MSHALVVGGTGMLRGVSLELARRGGVVTVAARAGERLASLVREGGGAIHPLAVDWHDVRALEHGLREACAQRGAFGRAVVWMHSDACEGLGVVLRAAQGADVVRVVGSTMEEVGADGVRTVRLGSMRTGGGRRWLTHEEIVAGVLDGLDSGRAMSVVGEVE